MPGLPVPPHLRSLPKFMFIAWRRKWPPTPVFLPGESQGQRRLVGCRPWGCTESDMTERLSTSKEMERLYRKLVIRINVRLVKAMVFPVVMYGCESWSIKRAECQRIDVFELWCWRRLLRVPWTAGDPSSPFQRKSVLNIHWKD